MTDHGLEWLGRLLIESRHPALSQVEGWRRYLIGNPLFLWRVLKQRAGLLHLDNAAPKSTITEKLQVDPACRDTARSQICSFLALALRSSDKKP